ncbi:uncharacterized protein F5Z01DRAFT_494346 [Emericellopsis atlantica]|uniref:Uncharacterized protein n=1 Tax=Emericellopsis atlantica TaxID=2614577 RepID=A0A9P7ZDP4_9HYPO|nr:uncharacterized protein F5Z01DRAFT_494346 [Emericellopsis atlantica]KAG9249558.1 hypothetical protein F5Z01DRAFT_494346 [Emericellopsis atlantica]
MHFNASLVCLLATCYPSFAHATTRPRSPFTRSLQVRQNGGNGQLNQDVIQQASASDGGPSNGQAPSQTDNNNFINFCQGQDLTNGEQKQGGSCNGIPMGKIPSTNRMVSAIFTNPKNGDTIASNTGFTISVQMLNFAPGTFTNPDNTYYSAPQDLDGNGNIIGHTHVTVQDLGGDQNPTTPLDPTTFAFFKGINDQGNGQGLLSADVADGLPAGNYRLCSLVAAANHQPVIMPVAQRGAQDDCVRFTVADNGGNNNGGNNNGGNNNGGNNNGGNNNGGNNNGGNNNGGNNNGGNQDNQNNGNQGGNNGANNGGGSGGASSATALGGLAAPAVEDSGDSNRPFRVNGDTFTGKDTAVGRACDVQRNACFDAVNSGQANGFTGGDCDNQRSACVTELSA